MTNIMLVSTVWGWGIEGRSKLPPGHTRKTYLLLTGILDDLSALLKLPTFTRGRHLFTRIGRIEVDQMNPRLEMLNKRIIYTTKQLHRQVEAMKKCGLPASEASRANQYNWYILARVERILNFKVSTTRMQHAHMHSFIAHRKQRDRSPVFLF